MRSDIEAAILGMYDSIERAREVQAAAGHSDQGARQGITSGKHLDPIAAIIRDDLINAGFHPDVRSMTKDACAHYRAGSVPPRTGTCWRLTTANS